MATKPSNAGKTHHSDGGEKTSTGAFPKKKGFRGAGGKGFGEWCGWRRGPSLAEGKGEHDTKTCLQTRKPMESGLVEPGTGRSLHTC